MVLTFRSRFWIGFRQRSGVWLVLTVMSLALMALSGCVGASPFQGVAPTDSAGAPASASALISSISELDNFELPSSATNEPTDVTALIITEGSRANVRSGPGLDFPIVAKANPGDTFQVEGISEDGEWWLICCVSTTDSASEDPSESAWLANVVLQADGDIESVPVVESLLPADLASEWSVEWQCGSERCEVKECSATIDASVAETASEDQYLPVDHNVTWDDACFSTDEWTFEVDQYTGRERSGLFNDNFLYNYWVGQNPGEATDLYSLEDGRQVIVVCTGPHEIELEEEPGWTTVYEGSTCYDIRTGMLVLLNYTKRWFFTGEYEGETYDRAYFGDYESLEQRLSDTNANLFFYEP